MIFILISLIRMIQLNNQLTMLRFNMNLQVRVSSRFEGTVLALVWFFASVYPRVVSKVATMIGAVRTNATFVLMIMPRLFMVLLAFVTSLEVIKRCQ